MKALAVTNTTKRGYKWIARAGLTAKGMVYLVLGAIALLAALHVGGQSSSKADKTGVFEIIKTSLGGNWLLFLLGAGLVCYAVWRFIETYSHFESGSHKKAARYLFSGLVYLSVAITAFKMEFSGGKKDGDSQQQLASELLSKPFGQWMLGLSALAIAGIGIYQIYYGLSGKYKKHVQKLSLHNDAAALLLASGKLGYTARGIVWLIVAFLSFRSALHSSAKDAGNTGKAFSLIEQSEYGSFLLGILAIGLVAYGVFNFIRARYEEFNQQLR